MFRVCTICEPASHARSRFPNPNTRLTASSPNEPDPECFEANQGVIQSGMARTLSRPVLLTGWERNAIANINVTLIEYLLYCVGRLMKNMVRMKEIGDFFAVGFVYINISFQRVTVITNLFTLFMKKERNIIAKLGRLEENIRNDCKASNPRSFLFTNS